ncbi:hypothetical protein HDU98_005865 [Podochytrium sp. JEL0797]|nr:hypothetical protein HDU98_005865 [Podochytrium sp. JEL0797]
MATYSTSRAHEALREDSQEGDKDSLGNAMPPLSELLCSPRLVAQVLAANRDHHSHPLLASLHLLCEGGISEILSHVVRPLSPTLDKPLLATHLAILAYHATTPNGLADLLRFADTKSFVSKTGTLSHVSLFHHLSSILEFCTPTLSSDPSSTHLALTALSLANRIKNESYDLNRRAVLSTAHTRPASHFSSHSPLSRLSTASLHIALRTPTSSQLHTLACDLLKDFTSFVAFDAIADATLLPYLQHARRFTQQQHPNATANDTAGGGGSVLVLPRFFEPIVNTLSRLLDAITSPKTIQGDTTASFEEAWKSAWSLLLLLIPILPPSEPNNHVTTNGAVQEQRQWILEAVWTHQLASVERGFVRAVCMGAVTSCGETCLAVGEVVDRVIRISERAVVGVEGGFVGRVCDGVFDVFLMDIGREEGEWWVVGRWLGVVKGLVGVKEGVGRVAEKVVPVVVSSASVRFNDNTLSSSLIPHLVSLVNVLAKPPTIASDDQATRKSVNLYLSAFLVLLPAHHHPTDTLQQTLWLIDVSHHLMTPQPPITSNALVVSTLEPHDRVFVALVALLVQDAASGTEEVEAEQWRSDFQAFAERVLVVEGADDGFDWMPFLKAGMDRDKARVEAFNLTRFMNPPTPHPSLFCPVSASSAYLSDLTTPHLPAQTPTPPTSPPLSYYDFPHPTPHPTIIPSPQKAVVFKQYTDNQFRTHVSSTTPLPPPQQQTPLTTAPPMIRTTSNSSRAPSIHVDTFTDQDVKEYHVHQLSASEKHVQYQQQAYWHHSNQMQQGFKVPGVAASQYGQGQRREGRGGGYQSGGGGGGGQQGFESQQNAYSVQHQDQQYFEQVGTGNVAGGYLEQQVQGQYQQQQYQQRRGQYQQQQQQGYSFQQQ